MIYGDSDGPSARLSNQLATSGFAVEFLADRSVAERKLQDDPRPVVIVPASAQDAEEQCAAFRRASGARIVVILPEASNTPANGDRTVATWLQAGADAVISGGLGRRELAARLRAALRNHRVDDMPAAARADRIGALEIDDAEHTVTAAGEAVSLTPTEFRLLAALARRPGRTVPRDDLIAEVWGHPTNSDGRTLRLYVGYLRRKLEAADLDGPTVLNQRGIGYRLAGEASLTKARASMEARAS